MASTLNTILDASNSDARTGNEPVVVRNQMTENTGLVMIFVPFDGTNWLAWSRSIHIALEGKDRLGFIDGSSVQIHHIEIVDIDVGDDGDEGDDSEGGDKEEKGGGDGDWNADEDDGMSDYCSDDHCEIVNKFDEEFLDDPLKGCLKRDAVEFSNAISRKIVFKKGMIFTNVNAFMDSLREFVTQEGCNPCHLKGPFGVVLLAAIGLDGNNELFPIAFAIAEMQCKESWMFFFENLSNMLEGFSHDRLWTFMTNRQKGLVETINEVATRSYDAVGCNFAMYEVKELKPTSYDWLLMILAKQWSRHAFDSRLKMITRPTTSVSLSTTG
ncbi:hypothetical protein Sango_2072400 [Sesamum angolense]|uniref:MULE transposase domain-containing protein n=1 Tax=Sesamum angolense TaxID=2727404 RepID=A0AAE1WBG2_9LAMI|nr:hypothetical protein Sango_2072400 [Sesamum angolense]